MTFPCELELRCENAPTEFMHSVWSSTGDVVLGTLASALIMLEIVKIPGLRTRPGVPREFIDPGTWLTWGLAPMEINGWVPSSIQVESVEGPTVLLSTEVWTLLIGFSRWIVLEMWCGLHHTLYKRELLLLCVNVTNQKIRSDVSHMWVMG